MMAEYKCIFPIPEGLPNGFRDSTYVVSEPLDSPATIRAVIRQLSDYRHDRLIVTRPIFLGKDAGLDMHFLMLLRTATSCGLRIDWNAQSTPSWDIALIHHLPPPLAVQDGKLSSQAKLAAWSGSYNYASCYYRRGPNFYQIVDERDQGRPRKFRITFSGEEDGFEHLQRPRAIETLSRSEQSLANSLLSLRLAVRIDNYIMSLPMRLRWWPIKVPWGV